MLYPDNLLVQGERVIVRKRPHWKVLILLGSGRPLVPSQ